MSRWAALHYHVPIVACKTCGKPGLHWLLVGETYLLVNPDETPHVCKPADVLLHAASDFKDCDE